MHLFNVIYKFIRSNSSTWQARDIDVIASRRTMQEMSFILHGRRSDVVERLLCSSMEASVGMSRGQVLNARTWKVEGLIHFMQQHFSGNITSLESMAGHHSSAIVNSRTSRLSVVFRYSWSPEYRVSDTYIANASPVGRDVSE